MSQQRQDERVDPNSFESLWVHSWMWAGFKVLTNPFDRLKVVLQGRYEIAASMTKHEKTLLPHDLDTVRGCARHLWKTEGFHGLWRGSGLGWLGSMAHSFGSVATMHFVDWLTLPQIGDAGYDRGGTTPGPGGASPSSASQQSGGSSEYYAYGKRFAASTLAGLGLSLVLYPIDLCRMMRMADLRFPQCGRVNHEYPILLMFFNDVRDGKFVFRTVPRGMIEDANAATINMLKFACLWRGYALSLLGMVLYRSVNFTIAFQILSRIRDPQSASTLDRPSLAQEAAFGFGLSMFTTACVYPLDVFRTRYVRGGFAKVAVVGGTAAAEHMPVQDMARMIYRHEGLRGFYRGALFALTVRAASLGAAAFGIPLVAESFLRVKNSA